MPGTPGHRHTGGAPHVSDAMRRLRADTPYDGASTMPMTQRTVGGNTYGQLVTNTQEGTR